MNLVSELAYLLSAFLFVAGLKQLSSPATARKGNQMAAVAMLIQSSILIAVIMVLDLALRRRIRARLGACDRSH